MEEVGGALVSIALVLCAVFVPTAFLGGISGQFFQQFAVTIAVATAISCFCSLTLSPALASQILQPHEEKRPPASWNFISRGWDRFTGVFNRAFDRLSHGYANAADFVIRHTLVMLLIYVSALARQRWNRQFAHTERMLVLLSGGACLLILASPGRRPVLPLVSSTMQQIVEHSLPVFTAERIVTTSILIAALISLFWLTRSRNRTDRIVLIALFGGAALCALVHYFFNPPPLLLLALILLMLGTLIAAKMEGVQQESRAHVGAEANIPADADTDTSILNGEV